MKEIQFITPQPKVDLEKLKSSSIKAMTTSQGVKIPDGPIVIDRDLLQDIRDLITLCTLIDKSGQCKAMSDKLDSLYPYLKC